VAPSTIGRYEAGTAQPRWDLFQQILELAGLRLTVVDAEGIEVEPVPDDLVRDNQGRRFPAHLDVAPPDEVPHRRRLFPRYDRPEAQGWFVHRAARDRLADASPDRSRQTDHPTRAELRVRRRLMRGRQPRVDPPPVVDPECSCLDACFEEYCVTSCPCRCEPDRRWWRA
jgi:HTH-type transcriptional regulator/antitoxin HipB